MQEKDIDKLLDLDIRTCNILYDSREIGQTWLGTIHHLLTLEKFGCYNPVDLH